VKEVGKDFASTRKRGEEDEEDAEEVFRFRDR
jgi:hypothetical protein